MIGGSVSIDVLVMGVPEPPYAASGCSLLTFIGPMSACERSETDISDTRYESVLELAKPDSDEPIF